MAEIVIKGGKIRVVPISTAPALVPLLLLLSCLSVLGQIINRAPHFVPQTGDMSHFSLMENTPVGTPVYQLKGIDPENGQLHYSISGQYFMVDRMTGVVTLIKPLDREKEDLLEVIISVTDEGIDNTEPNTVSFRRVIAIRDFNDNPPVFQNRPYRASISEAAEIGDEVLITPMITVTDRDEGSNAEVQVSCNAKEEIGDSESCSVFRIDTEKISEGNFQVRIFLRKPLDYETRDSYIIALEATDSSEHPLKAVTSVIVTVTDIQDQPPIFLNAPFSATVSENTPANTHIMEIWAKDGDSVNPRSILLTLDDDKLGYFDIISEKGSGKGILITTDIPIDREDPAVLHNGGVYTFSVKAIELINNEVPSDYTVTQITIVVTDVDDHIPKFNEESFQVSIPENIEAGSPIPDLSMYVEDNDLGLNSRYNLSIRDVFNSEDVFEITSKYGEGRTPIGIKVKNSSKLDYDIEDVNKRTFIFDIVASANGVEASSARVNIHLLDINDNPPIFSKSFYKFNVSEDSEIGSKIADIIATDKDYGIFGILEYILTGFGSFFFKTDKNEGGLFVNKALDYEKQKSYSLTLVAKDGGGKVSTAGIFIDVIDVNDNAPIFEANEYIRTIRDGANTFEPQFIVRATDADGPSQGGGKITYSIESDNSIGNSGNVFTIDEDSGEILITNNVNSMDTPRGQYDLIVRATDHGIPPLYNESRVLIRVGVPGNQRPTFKGNYHNHKYVNEVLRNWNNVEYTFEMSPMNYKASIKENSESGHNVTMIVANDPDGLDSLLTYHIIGGSKDNFIINETTGLITVSSEANLDRDINGDHYEIVVTAVDNGTPVPETATTTVFVTILDVNDKAPFFNTTNTTISISERKNIGESVTKITAIDTDLNSKLQYEIMEPVKVFSKSGVQLKSNNYEFDKLFKINEKTGEVFVNNTLDYTKASIVILTIKAMDVNAEIDPAKQFASIDLTIYIQPYSDKNPQFTNQGWFSNNPTIFHTVKEEQPIGSTILILTAEDPISGHIVSNFKVVNSETDFFQVDPYSGQVVLTRRLDYEELTNPNLTLSIKATSNDGSKYSVAKLIIHVENINDNAPSFEKSLYKLSVLESIKHPEIIVSIKASDIDSTLTDKDKASGYSEVRYSLRGENSDLFTIDSISGLMQVAMNKSLDREKQSVLRFDVIATDMPQGGLGQQKATAAILIDVLDVNDNVPQFEKNVYTAVIPENVQVGTSVIQVIATDPDEGLGGEIKYDLMNEGEANGLFQINQTSGEIRTRRALTGRGRTDPYVMIVRAQDGGDLYADTLLMMYIGDISSNDGIPVFIKPTVDQLAFVSENATIGSPVFQVVASDPDDPTLPSGKLTYTIQDNNADARYFSIDPSSGLITTNSHLDRERQDLYQIVIVVSDKGEPPQQATRILKVNITDVDDHKPRFQRLLDDPPVVLSIDEEQPFGTIVGQLAAIDEDIGENGAIDYAIIAGNEMGLFNLKRTDDNKAIIEVAARIDRETIARQLLSIKCFKLGTKPKLGKAYNRLEPSEIQALVKIRDIDDHLPEFPNPKVIIGIRLNMPIDTVITTLQAKDADPEAKTITYSIVNASFSSPISSRKGRFQNVTQVVSLNNKTGELKTIKNLIRYIDGIFRIIIRANNSEEDDRYADLELELRIVRERDLSRFVFGRAPGAVRGALPAFATQLTDVLHARGLALSLHDARVLARPDRTLDFTSTSSCFQLMRNGKALTPKEAASELAFLAPELKDLYDAHGMSEVGECAPNRTHNAATTAQIWLLIVAAFVGLATIISAITVCCLYSRFKWQSKKLLLTREIPPPASLVSEVPRMYMEPIYT